MERINIIVAEVHVRQANRCTSTDTDFRVCNPVSIAAEQALKAESAFCTAQSISFKFRGDVTYSQVYKLPAIAQDYLNRQRDIRVPFSFALSGEDRLW